MPPKKKIKNDTESGEMDHENGLSAKALAKIESDVTVPSYDQLSKEIKRAVGRSLEDYPRGENSAFRALVPKRDKEDLSWTDDQEEEIKQMVEQDGSLAQELCRCEAHIDTLWKTCFRFLGCMASDVVGRKNHLVYGSNSHRSKNVFWSGQFCQYLKYVMLHPHFLGNPAKMGLALQWASICRTDDRRKHSLNGCHDDIFLVMLQDAINSAPGEPPAVQLEIANRLFKDLSPDGQRPAWYQLLAGIDAATKQAKNKFDKVPEDMSELYMVTSDDVKAVLSGLDDIRYFSFRLYQHHETYYNTVAFTRCSDDRPGKKDVEKAIKQVVLSDLRHQKKQELLGPLGREPRRTDDGNGVDQDDARIDPAKLEGLLEKAWEDVEAIRLRRIEDKGEDAKRTRKRKQAEAKLEKERKAAAVMKAVSGAAVGDSDSDSEEAEEEAEVEAEVESESESETDEESGDEEEEEAAQLSPPRKRARRGQGDEQVPAPRKRKPRKNTPSPPSSSDSDELDDGTDRPPGRPARTAVASSDPSIPGPADNPAPASGDEDDPRPDGYVVGGDGQDISVHDEVGVPDENLSSGSQSIRAGVSGHASASGNGRPGERVEPSDGFSWRLRGPSRNSGHSL